MKQRIMCATVSNVSHTPVVGGIDAIIHFPELRRAGWVPATPRRLHAALASVLDLPPGVSPGRAARFANLACRPVHGAEALFAG